MSKININFNDYKASGVYFLEIDNSIIENINTASSVLVVGFSKKGPFNAPVFINNTEDIKEVYGDIDTKLERKGVFFNRNLQTLVKTSSVFALNLLPVDENDKTSVCKLGSKPTNSMNVDSSTKYMDLYDKSRFWKPSVDYLNRECVDSAINFGNVGTTDYTLFVRKAEDITGFNVSVADWYKSIGAQKPYAWMSDNDYMSDYFIQVVCVEGDWSNKNLATDLFWGSFFTTDTTKAILKKEKFSKFLKTEGVNVIGNYTGCILPNFYDKTGVLQSIVPIVNNFTTKTGLLMGISDDLLESAEFGDIDLIGHTLHSNDKITFMSYDCDSNVDTCDLYEDASIGNITIQENEIVFKGTAVNGVACNALSVGTMIGKLTGDEPLIRVVKRQKMSVTENGNLITKVKVTFTNNVADWLGEVAPLSSSFKIVPSIVSSYTTLSPIVMKGLNISDKTKSLFNTTSFTDGEYTYYGEDAPIAKIYSMLNDEGINRGLKNRDAIDFRYIVDTMAHGLGTMLGSKRYITNLAKDKERCTYFVNAPSVTEFSTTKYASYYDIHDTYATFNAKYIPTGGNEDAIRNIIFSLVNEDNGSKYGGAFSPFLKYNVGNRTILVPPAADVCVAYLAKYNGADPYITVANTNGVLNNGSIVGVEYAYDDTDRGYLEPFGINPIISRNGRVMIYGDRTCYQDVLSDFNYLHVREILNTVEIECNAVLQNYVFRYNNAQTRAEVVQRINPILKGMKDAGALYNYEIAMDENNNTNEVIDRSFAIIDIGVWVTKNMEKIIARITVNKLAE